MQKRQVLIGLGVLALAGALALPVIAHPRSARPGWGAGGRWSVDGPRAAPNAAAVTSIDAAAARARAALSSFGTDLVVAEVMEFSNHFYVLVKEKSTGVGALELIVERGGFVHPERGPSMMWNTKYGPMAGTGSRQGPRGMMGPGRRGMMGGRGPGFGPGAGPQGPRGLALPPAAQPLSEDIARQNAAQHLTLAFPGTTPDEGTAFYGYFTFDVQRSGKPVGMISVNALTGAVWYHGWHGTFVAEKTF